MSATQASTPLLPVNHLLQIPDTEKPFLQGLQCSQCHKVFTDKRITCPACYSREGLEAKRLADKGHVLAFTVVRRSFPGLPVPFISAVVALEGGGDIKVNLENMDVDDTALQVGLAVELIFKQAPWGDEHGNEYLVYAVQPADQLLRLTKGA